MQPTPNKQTAPDERIANWVASYRKLADEVVRHNVQSMKEEFPDEKFPVRPPYRKAMYHRLMNIVDELNQKIAELLDESPDETDEPLKEQLMQLQESYEQQFLQQVRKVDPNRPDVRLQATGN